MPGDVAYAKKEMIVRSFAHGAVIASENLMLFVIHGDIHTLIPQTIGQEAAMDAPSKIPGIRVDRRRPTRRQARERWLYVHSWTDPQMLWLSESASASAARIRLCFFARDSQNL
jgi:hypothetical protein